MQPDNLDQPYTFGHPIVYQSVREHVRLLILRGKVQERRMTGTDKDTYPTLCTPQAAMQFASQSL